MSRGSIAIALAEDNPGDARLIQEMLSELPLGSFALERSSSLGEALNALERGRFDVLLLDLNLPDSHGLETFERVVASTPSLPVIVLSGADDEELAARAVSHGAQDYLVKGQVNSFLLKRAILYAIERKQTEQRMRETAATVQASEKRYRLLFDEHPHPLWLIDIETSRFVDVNVVASREYGYSRADFLAMTIEEIRADVAATDVHDPGQRHRRKNGTIIDVEVTAHEVELGDRPTRLESVVDVTARRRTEETLRARARQQEVIVLLGQHAIETTDFAGLFDVATSLVRETLNVTHCQVLEMVWGGKLVLRAGVGWSDGCVGDAVLKADADSQAGYTLEHNAPVTVVDVRSDPRFPDTALLRQHGIVSGVTVVIPGQHRPFGVLGAHTDHARTFTGDDIHFLQAVANILGTAIDRDRAEMTYRQAQRLEAIGRLAGGVAHDFNNLLTAISGYSYVVLDNLGPDDPAREDVGEIQKAATRAASLTQQLLAFSRKQVLESVPLDLNCIVKDMENMLQRLIGASITMHTSLDPNLGIVAADPGQMEQVIVNLVVNARDAMPNGGRLIVETTNQQLDAKTADPHHVTQPGRYVRLTVSDSGIGMDKETQSRIFEPFFTTKGSEQGTGLGLATVYGIVHQSGGGISVSSEPGQGTSFTIYLPLVDQAVRVKPVAKMSAPKGGGETVLIAEDEELVRKLTERVLREAGYEVLVAQNGTEALLLSERHKAPIHLLVSDMVMPLMDGCELSARLPAKHPETRVLFTSGYTDPSSRPQALLDGGAAFLQKPFTAETLTRKVRELLDAPRVTDSREYTKGGVE